MTTFANWPKKITFKSEFQIIVVLTRYNVKDLPVGPI